MRVDRAASGGAAAARTISLWRAERREVYSAASSRRQAAGSAARSPAAVNREPGRRSSICRWLMFFIFVDFFDEGSRSISEVVGHELQNKEPETVKLKWCPRQRLRSTFPTLRAPRRSRAHARPRARSAAEPLPRRSRAASAQHSATVGALRGSEMH